MSCAALAVLPLAVVSESVAIGGPAATAITAGGMIQIQVGGQAGVASDASAVTLHVTATESSHDGYLTVFPCGGAVPTASNVNFTAGRDSSNTVISKLGSGGKVCVYASAAVDLVLDVVGWFDSAAKVSAVSPVRILDTRAANKLDPEVVTVLNVRAAVPSVGSAQAVILNATAVNPVGAGYLTIYPCDAPRPLASNVNFTPGDTTPNLAVVAMAGDGTVCLVSNTAVDVVIDLGGWVGQGTGSKSITPTRIVDTRLNQGAKRVAAGSTTTVGIGQVPSGAVAALVNVTSTNSNADGYITVFPCDDAPGETSSLNPVAGASVSNYAVAALSGGSVCLFSSVATDLVVDLNGWVQTGAHAITPVRLIDTRPSPGNPPSVPNGFPSAESAGVPAGFGGQSWTFGLKTSAATGPTESRGGMTCKVLDGYNVSMSGGQYFQVDDPCVIFKRMRFTTSGAPSNTSAMVQQAAVNKLLFVESSDFDGGPMHVRGVQGDFADMTINSSEFARFGNAAIEMNNRNGSASLTVTNSYLYEVKGWQREAHADGIQVGGAKNVTITNNTVLVELWGGTVGDTSNVSNSALGLWAELGNVTGTVTVNANLLAGGGRTIYIEQKSPYSWQGPVNITNNVFDMRFGPKAAVWGPLAVVGLPANLTWTGNTFSDGTSISLQQAKTQYP